MKTLLLLAGQSKRFWPLSEKPLFPICGKALLMHVVERLEAAGCDDIIFIGSKNNLDEAKEVCASSTTLGMTHDFVEQENLKLGMRGAILSALPRCDDEPLLIVGASDVIESDAYKEVVKIGKKGAGAILAQKVTRYFPGGYLSLDGERIAGIVEKPGAGNEPSDLVNIVCHYHQDTTALAAALRAIDDETDDGYGYERALQNLFADHTYRAVPYDGVWQSVKYPWHLLQLLPMLLGDVQKLSLDASAQIHASAVIEGNVVIEEDVRVLPHATIIGPCFIGRGTIVGTNALIRGSSVGEQCVIGYNTEVKGSVLHSHVWTHSTYIGDSVIGHNVSFGGGSVTGNLRLDEGEIFSQVCEEKVGTALMKFGTIIGDHCRLGIHSSINPGVKIGAHSFVGTAAVVDSDLPDGTFASMKEGALHLRPNTASAPKPQEREKYRKKL